MEIVPLGDSALVVRVREQFEDAPEETLDEVLPSISIASTMLAIPGVIELAPAYTSVAVFFDPIAVAKVERHSRTRCSTSSRQEFGARLFLLPGAHRGRRREAT